MKKVSFVLPPTGPREFKSQPLFKDYLGKIGPYSPLGLLSLANAIKKHIPQAQIQILDGQFLSKEDIIRKMSHFSPNFVGISPTIRGYRNALEIARFAKSLGARVILGGSHASNLAKEILLNRGPCSKDYCIDAVVRQDGEEAICGLIEENHPSQINNLVWQDKSGRIVENQIKNVGFNKTSFLDRDFIDVETYFEEQRGPARDNKFKRGLTIISQKGCAWRARSGGCIFCAGMHKEISAKSPERFWEEALYLVNHYNLDLLWDISDNFLEDEKWLENLTAIRPFFGKAEKKFCLEIMARIDKINKRTVKLLENLNLAFWFVVGFESGSDKILKAMNKGYSSLDAIRGMELLQRLDSRVTASFVLGGPGENRKTLLETVNFAQKLKKMGVTGFTPHILVPIHNSRAFELMVSKNRLKYADRDLIGTRELIEDWMAGFCDVNFDEILEAYQKIGELAI